MNTFLVAVSTIPELLRYPKFSKFGKIKISLRSKIDPRNLNFKCFLKEVPNEILAENVSKALFEAKPNRLAEDLRGNHGKKKRKKN